MNKEDLWKLHTNITEWIKVADSKALFSLGVISLMASMLGIFIDKDLLSFFKSDLSSITFITFIGYVIVTMISSIIVLFPVLKTRFNSSKSNIFFMDIANYSSPDEYSDALDNNLNIEKELKNQIFINSCITKRKYISLNWSLYYLFFSIFAFIFLLTISA